MEEEKKVSEEPSSGSVPPPEKKQGKIDWNARYNTIAVYATLLILAAVLCVNFFRNYGNLRGMVESVLSAMSPIFLGIVFAYLLNPLLRFFENKVFARVGQKKNKHRARRALAVTATYVVFLAFLAGFFVLLIPQVLSGGRDFMDNLSGYIASVNDWLSGITAKNPAFAGPIAKLTEFVSNLVNDVSDLIVKAVPAVTGALTGVLTALKNSLLGIALSIYFLFAKEQLGAMMKKICRSVFSEKRYQDLIRDVKIVDEKFSGYCFGTIVDSLLLGVVCFIIMAIIGTPYYPLISLIIAVTNVIPFFGPIIGAVIGAFIIFLVSPIDVVWFLIMSIVVQQIEGNYITPKVVGSTTDLAPVWVMIATVLMSGLLGFIGMLIGVPLFAVLFVFVKRKVNRVLAEKDKQTENQQ